MSVSLMSETKTTLSDHLDSWLKDIAKPRVSNTTFAGYDQQLRIVKSTIGNVKLKDLSPKDI